MTKVECINFETCKTMTVIAGLQFVTKTGNPRCTKCTKEFQRQRKIAYRANKWNAPEVVIQMPKSGKKYA